VNSAGLFWRYTRNQDKVAGTSDTTPNHSASSRAMPGWRNETSTPRQPAQSISGMACRGQHHQLARDLGAGQARGQQLALGQAFGEGEHGFAGFLDHADDGRAEQGHGAGLL